MTNTWKTIRVYVDVPVRGNVHEKDIIWGVQAALDAGYYHIKRRSFGSVAYGKVTAKSKSKCDAYERRRTNGG